MSRKVSQVLEGEGKSDLPKQEQQSMNIQNGVGSKNSIAHPRKQASVSQEPDIIDLCRLLHITNDAFMLGYQALQYHGENFFSSFWHGVGGKEQAHKSHESSLCHLGIPLMQSQQ